jgi:dolichol-phosphate mannosyltransferase
MNEEGNIELIVRKIKSVMEQYNNYEIIFVDDGSTDDSLRILKQLHSDNQQIKYISFSRNFGHQYALKAGLDYARGDCVISLDGDMQHPPELIPDMIEKWKTGEYDIIYTIRKENKKLSFFKRTSSCLFYKILNYFADINIEPGSADFRLLDRSVVDCLKQFHENSLFFRGIIQWIGFKQSAIEYMPNERFWGISKYSVKKMFNFALNGILSFSVKPLLFSIYFGIFISLCSFCYGFYAVFLKIFTNNSVSGWTSTLAVISFIGGIQLIVLGIIGTYIGKIFVDIKSRPLYIIREKTVD